MSPSDEQLELTPPQPAAVARAVAELLAGPAGPDPWWQAGLDEALGT